MERTRTRKDLTCAINKSFKSPHSSDFIPFLTSPFPKQKVSPSSSSHQLSVARHCFKSVPFHCPCLSFSLFFTVFLSDSLIHFGMTPPSEVPQIFSLCWKNPGKKNIVMEDAETVCHSSVGGRETVILSSLSVCAVSQ